MMRPTPIALIASACLLIGAGSAFAQYSPRQEMLRRYDACMAAARARPAQALEDAQTWQGQGGGLAAAHCEATSLFYLRRYAEAATLLQQLVGSAGPVSEGQLLVQLGQALSLSGDLQGALQAQTRAVDEAPDDPERRIDRAITLAELRRYGDAVADLSRVLSTNPARGDALLLRAAALRNLGNLAAAREDIEKAAALMPDDPEVLIEGGMIAALAGDTATARARWKRVGEVAPNSLAAARAAALLDKLPKG